MVVLTGDRKRSHQCLFKPAGQRKQHMRSSDILAAGREQALAFRLASHHLAVRLPPGSLLAAAGACGIQDSPPGSTALALHARVSRLQPEDVARTLADRTLLMAMSFRGAPLIFPTADADVFTAGVLPDDEESLRFFIQGARPGLDKVGMSATELVDLTATAMVTALDGRALTKDELGVEIGNRITVQLDAGRRTAWQSASLYVPGQFLGESLARFAMYAVSLQGLFCYVPRQENKARFVRMDQWLGAMLPAADPSKARAELVRRYLRCYGPSTPEHFAQWAGISPTQASRAWALVGDELTGVDFDGKSAWLLRDDATRFMSPRTPAGVRFLPPHEPLLQMRDRETLVPDKSWHRKLWRTVGNPGILLAEGNAVAAWRSRKSGKRMDITIEQFETIPQALRPEIEAEAATLAPYGGCVSVRVEYK
jgi:hypothetical protein